MAACGYALLIMAVYWVTEALPLAITALLPIVLFPILGILKGADVASAYIAVCRTVSVFQVFITDIVRNIFAVIITRNIPVSYCVVWSVFRYFEPYGRDSQV